MSWKKIILYTVVTSLLLSVSCIIGGSSQAGNDAKVNEESSGWVHLSSANGDLPEPSESTEQTASLIFDVNKDGVNDFIIGARKSPGPALVWYQRETNGWTRHVIDDAVLDIEAGGAYHDIDADGDLDIVMGGDYRSNKVWWWENPYPNFGSTWNRREIKSTGANQHHDQIFGDFDGDGNTEFVFWNQGASSLFLADIPSNPLTTQPWFYTAIYNYSGAQHEGLAKADIDGDGILDIVGGGRWFKHTGGNNYTENVVDDRKSFTRAAAGQLKAGGRPEIVFVAGDGTGPLDWYEWNGSSWTGNNLLGFDVDHGHSLEVADINGDGNMDIFVAEMRLNGDNPDAKMWVFQGDGNSNFTETQVASGYGNHESKIGDLDGDGDLDILGKPYNWDTPRLDVWLNELSSGSLPLDRWQRHVIDNDRPWRAIFITAADMDGDNLKDIITGGWWYKNPGDDPSGTWTRSEIGSPLNNMATVYDFDNDNDLDILGTTGQGSNTSDTFVWAQNNGSGQFNILDNVSNGDGDFLQGVSVGKFQNGDLAVALSWHQGNKGVQLITVPGDPVNQTWPWSQISPVSQDEALSSGDIDKDGDLDLLLGTKWLRNEGADWTAFDLYIPNGDPDRNRLTDINGNGNLDAVVGYEATSIPGTLAWYEQGQDPTGLWTEHIIADPAIIGPMSLDVADMDADGDMDVVVGEHNTANPSSASLYVFENLDGSGLDWTRHLVYTGDEHHDGAQVFDIDNDGDLDIISIGWTHDRVVLYENKATVGTIPDTYTLGVNTVASGTVLVNPNKTSYNPGDTVQLTAQPAPGCVFDKWSGDLTGSANPATLVMDSDKLVTATFRLAAQNQRFLPIIIQESTENITNQCTPMQGLVALYKFDESSGTVIHDVSGVEPRLDLLISNGDTQWLTGGGLSINTPALITSAGAAEKVNEAIRQGNQFTIETWIKSNNLEQDGPARIVTLSADAQNRNFTLGQGLWNDQPSALYDVRLRTTDTDDNGQPSLTTQDGSANTDLTHLAYVRQANGDSLIYKNGAVAASEQISGDLSNWDTSYRLALANEVGGGRPWLGELYRIAVYSCALSQDDVYRSFKAGLLAVTEQQPVSMHAFHYKYRHLRSKAR